MSNNAFVGKIFLWREGSGSPALFSRVCQVFEISGLGQTNEQVDATTFCSGGVKEYISGLADGAEMTLTLNFETLLPDAQVILDMIQDVKDKAVRGFEIRCDANGDGTDEVVFKFWGTCLSWTLTPSASAKNQIAFGIKISGDILVLTA